MREKLTNGQKANKSDSCSKDEDEVERWTEKQITKNNLVILSKKTQILREGF